MNSEYEYIANIVYEYLFEGTSLNKIGEKYKKSSSSISNDLRKFGFNPENGANKSYFKDYIPILENSDIVDTVSRFLNSSSFKSNEGNINNLEEYIKENNEEHIKIYNDRIANISEYVSSIKINNFKNIESLKLDLGRITCLVGNNTAGKSSILQAVQFSISNSQVFRIKNGKEWKSEVGKLRIGLDEAALLYKPSEHIDSLAHNNNYTQSKDISTEFYLDNEKSLKTKIMRGKNRNNSIYIERKGAADSLLDKYTNFISPFSMYTPGISGISLVEEKRPQSIVTKVALGGNSNTVLRNILLQAKINNVLSEIKNRLNELYPNIIDIDVYFDDLYSDYINVTLKRKYEVYEDSEISDVEKESYNTEKNVKYTYSETALEASSTGELQILQILSYIYVYKPMILLLDEPDSHLHPGKQKELMHMLHRIAVESERKFQIVLTTHSHNVLNALSDYDDSILHHIVNGKIYRTMKNDDKFEIYETFLHIGALDEIDEYNKLSYLFITEDSDKKYLKNILSQYFKERSNRYIYGREYKIISSNDGSTSIISTLKSIVSLIRNRNNKIDIKIVVHRDRDFDKDTIEDFEEEIKKLGAIPFVTKGSDIESYYADIDHVCNVFPEIDKEKINNFMNNEWSSQKYISEVKERALSQMGLGGNNKKNKKRLYRIANQQIEEEMSKDTDGYFKYGKKDLRIINKYIQDNYSDLSSGEITKTAPRSAVNHLRKIL